MECHKIKDAILEYTKGRFMPNSQEEWVDMACKSMGNDLADKTIIQLRRISVEVNNWRTFLIVVCDPKKDYEKLLEWTGIVRDELLDPETSDLYLILGPGAAQLTIEQCVSIEADEKFCRKYILRPRETITDSLSRTCLAAIDEIDKESEIHDPLLLALNSTSSGNSWLNSELKEGWKRALLSGKTGDDLIELLFNEPNTDESSNEIS